MGEWRALQIIRGDIINLFGRWSEALRVEPTEMKWFWYFVAQMLVLIKHSAVPQRFSLQYLFTEDSYLPTWFQCLVQGQHPTWNHFFLFSPSVFTGSGPGKMELQSHQLVWSHIRDCVRVMECFLRCLQLHLKTLPCALIITNTNTYLQQLLETRLVIWWHQLAEKWLIITLYSLFLLVD